MVPNLQGAVNCRIWLSQPMILDSRILVPQGVFRGDDGNKLEDVSRYNHTRINENMDSLGKELETIHW